MSSDAIEVQATKVVKREADQASGSHDQINVEDEASGSHDQPIEENQKLSIVIHGKPTTSKILQESVIKCYSDDELAWMFLVDGCAMLNFIHRVVKDDEKVKKLNIKKDQNAEKEEIGKSINKFIGESIMTTEPSSVTKEYGKEPSPSHLLELLREELINRSANITAKNIKPENRNREPHSFRNVKELIASGIRLKPTGERSLTISFERSCFAGTLKLPSLLVDDSTAPKLKNLIALEMCPDFLKDFEVTSYICFLDSLIDHPEDVQELRKAKILTNVLGSDKEVAKLFNKIGTDLVPNPDLYANVKADIEKHYKSRWKTYTAEAYHTYFSSPWTFLALLGALLALLFSAVQAYFSLPSEKC
ncbi:hypothetical protein GH714_034310 [Hevea brasiliensis]|uniref:Uncharacterized protein n=1 Tax=Hevea brasiliensis TaxID=3981 RepID=A0A6A6KPD4_HEVBR|nr:hypothetical protein GH714_034310 [Hevea brasiliensis]